MAPTVPDGPRAGPAWARSLGAVFIVKHRETVRPGLVRPAGARPGRHRQARRRCGGQAPCRGRAPSGLTARRAHKPDALSGGEQQRTAIARALAADPAIVLADEPTGSLDSIAGQEICRLLRDLCSEQRRTIVVVTHEPAVAVWADRIVVLRDGADLREFRPSGDRDPQAVARGYQDALKTGAEASR